MFLEYSTERKSLNSFVDVCYWSYPFPSVHKSYIVICLGNRECYSHHECLIYLYDIIFVGKSCISAFLAQDFYILFLSLYYLLLFVLFILVNWCLKNRSLCCLTLKPAGGHLLVQLTFSLFLLPSLPSSVSSSLFSFLPFFW